MKTLLVFTLLLISSTHASSLSVCISRPIHHYNDKLHLKVYEPLFKHFGKEKTIIPLIAKKWTKSSDGLRYNISLREKIDFHTQKFFTPTRHLNTSDVEMSLKASPLYLKEIKSIQIKNELELSINLNNPDEKFIEKLTKFNTSIKSKEFSDFLKKKTSDKSYKILTKLHIGSGPFVISNVSDSIYEFTSFNKYHLGKVQFDTLYIKYILSDAKRTSMMGHGLCNIAYNADLSAASTLDKSKFEILPMNKVRTLYLGINESKKVLADKEVQNIILKNLNIQSWSGEYFYDQAVPQIYNENTNSLDKILRMMKVDSLGRLRMSSYKISPTWCPKCKHLMNVISQNISKSLESSVNLDRKNIPPKLNHAKLQVLDFVVSDHEIKNFINYPFVSVKKILVIDKMVHNFFYMGNQEADYSIIDFKINAAKSGK